MYSNRLYIYCTNVLIVLINLKPTQMDEEEEEYYWEDDESIFMPDIGDK